MRSGRGRICASAPTRWPLILTAWKRLLGIGLPAGVEFGLIAVYMGVVYVVSQPFGAAAQAGFGIGQRVGQAGFMPIVALGFAVAPVAGQNFGARTWATACAPPSASPRCSRCRAWPVSLPSASSSPAAMIRVLLERSGRRGGGRRVPAGSCRGATSPPGSCSSSRACSRRWGTPSRRWSPRWSGSVVVAHSGAGPGPGPRLPPDLGVVPDGGVGHAADGVGPVAAAAANTRSASGRSRQRRSPRRQPPDRSGRLPGSDPRPS